MLSFNEEKLSSASKVWFFFVCVQCKSGISFVKDRKNSKLISQYFHISDISFGIDGKNSKLISKYFYNCFLQKLLFPQKECFVKVKCYDKVSVMHFCPRTKFSNASKSIKLMFETLVILSNIIFAKTKLSYRLQMLFGILVFIFLSVAAIYLWTFIWNTNPHDSVLQL